MFRGIVVVKKREDCERTCDSKRVCAFKMAILNKNSLSIHIGRFTLQTTAAIEVDNGVDCFCQFPRIYSL